MFQIEDVMYTPFFY